MGFLAKIVMWLIARTIREEATETSCGLESSVGRVVLIFPSIVLILFTWIGCLAVQDPDPDDRITGYVLFGVAVLLGIYLIHLASYRLVANQERMMSRSLIARERRIDFTQRFDLAWADDDSWFRARQGSTSIKISSLVHGYPQLFDLVHRRYRRF